jgi:protein gp37
LCRREVICEPLLERLDLSRYLAEGRIDSVSCGGESGDDARVCDFDWVLDLRRQCVDAGVAFRFRQTGARLRKEGRIYRIRRQFQHSQARRASVDFIVEG